MEPIRSWWEDSNCKTANVAAICQHDRLCPGGWTLFSGHCFLLVTSAVTWENAELDCYNKGGYLASIHSADENNFIHSLAPSNNLWIGGMDVDVEVDQQYNYIHYEFKATSAYSSCKKQISLLAQ